jgi:hypothetical protein
MVTLETIEPHPSTRGGTLGARVGREQEIVSISSVLSTPASSAGGLHGKISAPAECASDRGRL